MNQVNKIKNLARLSYFDKNTLSQFVELSDNSLYANIKRWLRSGRLIQLKKGLYVTSDFVSAQKNPSAYLEFIANKLKEPSYLSMEYVLQKHNILSESVFGFTSVALKSKRTYKNKFGLFAYRNIREDLFDGYDIRQIEGFSLKVATKAKALFDYFYYRLLRVKDFDAGFIKSFRLNLHEMTNKEMKEFSGYCKAARTKKMEILAQMVGGKHD